MYNLLLKCRNHPLFAAIIVISADPLISKWLKQSRARFSDGNWIGARGHAGGYWREWQFENNYVHFQNFIEQNHGEWNSSVQASWPWQAYCRVRSTYIRHLENKWWSSLCRNEESPVSRGSGIGMRWLDGHDKYLKRTIHSKVNKALRTI